MLMCARIELRVERNISLSIAALWASHKQHEETGGGAKPPLGGGGAPKNLRPIGRKFDGYLPIVPQNITEEWGWDQQSFVPSQPLKVIDVNVDVRLSLPTKSMQSWFSSLFRLCGWNWAPKRQPLMVSILITYICHWTMEKPMLSD